MFHLVLEGIFGLLLRCTTDVCCPVSPPAEACFLRGGPKVVLHGTTHNKFCGLLFRTWGQFSEHHRVGPSSPHLIWQRPVSLNSSTHTKPEGQHVFVERRCPFKMTLLSSAVWVSAIWLSTSVQTVLWELAHSTVWTEVLQRVLTFPYHFFSWNLIKFCTNSHSKRALLACS